MKLALCVVLALAVGFALGWFLSPGPYRHFYRSTAELELADREGKVVARLPSGTPFVSDSRLFSSADLGWWGYVPVYFPTMAAAQKLGLQEGEKVTSVTEMPLSAVVDERTYVQRPDEGR